MKTIYEFAEACLHHADIDAKIALTHQAWQLFQHGKLDFSKNNEMAAISKTRFPEKPVLMAPRFMAKRSLNSKEGLAAFFHALTHIEFVAIYLAWDILYRFRHLPIEFQQDWLQVAQEEALHFEMLRTHLKKLAVDYGDLPAHKGLWLHAEDTAHDVLARLAIVPRCMEARGLDVTPGMIEKIKSVGDAEGVEILSRILKDEIGHVKTGSYWFKYICQLQGVDSEQKYQELIKKYYVGKPKGPFNREMRIIAGFSQAEIDWLEKINE